MTHARLTTDLRETVIAIAQEAAAEVMQIYAGSFDVAMKQDDSPVTAADLVLPGDVMKAIDKVSREIMYPMG